VNSVTPADVPDLIPKHPNEADMLLVPVPEAARLDPFLTAPTLAVICAVEPLSIRPHPHEFCMSFDI
jgi:glutamine synthetase